MPDNRTGDGLQLLRPIYVPISVDVSKIKG
jgi:hypothetical protein